MLVSVIVPVYNVEKHIRHCLDSILAQSFSCYELVLVDDGSVDRSSMICDLFAEKDSRLVVIHQNHSGVSCARNMGLDYAFTGHSKYVSFVDGDDWIHCQYLEILLYALHETRTRISICAFTRKQYYGESDSLNQVNCCTVDTEKFYCNYTTNAVVVWGKLFFKDDFIGVRFPVGKLHEDEMTTYKVLFRYPRLSYVSEELYCYFINEQGIMGREWRPQRVQLIEALEENLEFFYSNKFFEAYCNRLQMIKKSICIYMDTIFESNNSSYIADYIPFLRKKLRKYIRVCKKFGTYNFDDDKWAFGLAYPKLMNLYWVFQTIKNKIFSKRSD